MHRIAIFFALILTLVMASVAGAMDFKKALKTADTQKKYLFYLHGAIMEEQGKGATSPRHGLYHYDRIIEHFEDRGLTVIEEVRPKTNPNKYASTITMRIRQLMAAGVPAQHITVAGFSKGGYIALLVASSLGNPNVGYVVMAGCGTGQNGFVFDQFLKKKRGARLQGRILSLYTSSDLSAGSCRAAIVQAQGKNGLQFREVRIMSGKGHGHFYQPRPDWIEPTAIFAKGGR